MIHQVTPRNLRADTYDADTGLRIFDARWQEHDRAWVHKCNHWCIRLNLEDKWKISDSNSLCFSLHAINRYIVVKSKLRRDAFRELKRIYNYDRR